MAKFTIYSPSGTALYTGAPTFTGQYMKPGLLEFREVALPALVELVPGCYVDYTRTGRRYRIYTVPQLKKQARSLSYGGAFVYQSVQLYDASKMLEYCPFRDLVLGDNRIHFSTQPSISTFEGCDGLARRFEACLVDQYGEGSWRVRIATAEENPSLHDLMLEPRDFTVSGVNILECLDKIYEIWPEVGWIYKVELVDGVPTDTIIIGGGGINSNTGSYAYGKGNGLTSLTRTAANAEEIANRIFAYGSSRNMVLPSWYRNQDIKDAESVDIENIMLPILPIVSKDWAGWGLTDGERDAAKAFVEDAASILKNGLRPATVYFDGKGEYPEIYPSIRETTIGMVRNALGDSTAKYYPSTEIYTDSGARVDKLLSAQAAFDSGKAGADGKSSTDVGYIAYEHSAATPIAIPAGSVHTEAFASGTIAVSGSGRLNIELSYPGIGLLTGCGSVYLDFSFVKVHGGTTTTIYTQRVVMNPSDAGGHSVPEGKITYAGNTLFESGDSLAVAVNLVFNNQSGATDTSAFLTNASGTMTVKTSNHRDKTFTISLRQLGFDINEQADLGNGKTIAMRTGDCAGRSFSIKSVQYNSANDCWDLECWRSEDESLSQWFPNSQFGVAVGDEFVLLDIAMPDIYIAMASEKLLDAARDLLEESAVERWQYNPEIDAKFIVENSRTINAGEYLILSDADIIGPSAESILVDAITINEGEAAIPTYKVTLRDRKKKTWTESQSPEQSSSKSVGSITDGNTQQSSNGGSSSFFQLDEAGNVTLKPQYQNLWVPGWLASGGIGQGGSGGGGLIDGVYTANYLGTIYSPTGTDDITKTFSAFAIDKIWQAVLDLQQSTPNVSLVNGANNSTLTVNGVIADFYTKSQVDAIVGAVYRPAGNASSVSALGALTAANIGKVYNMTAAFTTTADFLEGTGKSFPAGTNVVIVDAGSGTYKYDVLSGFVDLSGYVNSIVTGSGNYITGVSKSGNQLTFTYGTLPTLSKGTIIGSGNAVIDISVSGHTISLTKGITFITNGDVLQTTNPFMPGHSLYISKIDNALYAADKRFTVTGELISGETTTAVTSGQLAGLFDGNYDSGYELRDGKTLKIHIKFDGWPNSYFPGYPYGYFFMSFYYVTKPQSVSARCYCNYEAHGIGWHDMTVANLSRGTSANLYRFYNGYYAISEFEFTIVGDTTNSYGYTYITQLELQLTRPAPSHNPFVSKYVAEELYYPLTIKAGLSVTGNTSVGGTLGVTGATTLSNTLSVANAITLSGSTNSARRIYFGDTSHYLELDQYGFHFSHGVYSDDFVSAGGIGNGGGSGGATELGDLVDVSLSSRSNGDLLVYNSATSHWENKPQSSIIPTVSVSFDDLTSHPTTLAGYGITDANIANGVITLGGSTITPLTTETDPTVPSWAKADNKPSYSLTEISGTDDLRAIEALTGTAGLLKKTAENTWALDTTQYLSAHQSVTLASGTNNGTLKLTTAAGTVDNIAVKGLQALAYKASLLASDIPDLSGTYVTIAGAQTITGAKTLSADLTLSENLVMGAAKHIDIGPVRLEFANGALHVTTNDLTNYPSIGFYADGFSASGGIGNGGGGGFGVEQITTNEDGTIDFHFTGGDVTTVDLNHEHPQYPKYVQCTQADYDALTTKDSGTLYLIPATA